MEELVNSNLGELYMDFFESLPFWTGNFLNLALIAILIFLYAFLIWKFYRFIAKKNLFNLNLKRFNTSSHPILSKIIEISLYLLEYLIILPLLVFVWFGVFTILLLLLTENVFLDKLLIVSATIVTAIRMAAYYKEDLSKELAKLLPLTLLGVYLTLEISIEKSNIFNFSQILNQLSSIPLLLNKISVYLVFIISIEFILRLFEVIFLKTGLTTPEEIKEDS